MATYKVDDFKTVKTDRYIEGDFFYTEKGQFGILIPGATIKTIGAGSGMTKRQVEKIVDEKLKGAENNVD